jgi:hypothetical protein
MPEFSAFLSTLEQLRLGVPHRTPRELAGFLADIARTHDVVDDVARLREVLIDVILEVHGPLGLHEFLQEYAKRVRR